MLSSFGIFFGQETKLLIHSNDLPATTIDDYEPQTSGDTNTRDLHSSDIQNDQFNSSDFSGAAAAGGQPLMMTTTALARSEARSASAAANMKLQFAVEPVARVGGNSEGQQVAGDRDKVGSKASLGMMGNVDLVLADANTDANSTEVDSKQDGRTNKIGGSIYKQGDHDGNVNEKLANHQQSTNDNNSKFSHQNQTHSFRDSSRNSGSGGLALIGAEPEMKTPKPGTKRTSGQALASGGKGSTAVVAISGNGGVTGSNSARVSGTSGFGGKQSSGQSVSGNAGGTSSHRAYLASDNERHKRKLAKARERRATLILGLIMAAFICSWLPFFTFYVLRALCHVCRDYISPRFESFIFWMGYCNSAINPIIYTIFNRDFRKAFRKILFKCL